MPQPTQPDLDQIRRLMEASCGTRNVTIIVDDDHLDRVTIVHPYKKRDGRPDGDTLLLMLATAMRVAAEQNPRGTINRAEMPIMITCPLCLMLEQSAELYESAVLYDHFAAAHPEMAAVVDEHWEKEHPHADD